MSLSVTVIQGNLGQEPEFKNNKKGELFVTFSVGVGRNFKDPSGNYVTDWFKVVCWNAATANYLQNNGFSKGSKVVVKGRMQSDKSDDGKIWWSLVADEVSFNPNENGGSGKSQPKGTPAGQKSYKQAATGYDVDDDDQPPF